MGDKTRLLVMIGVRPDGSKELLALPNGHRRGRSPPVLAAGDGPLGFWKAVRDVFPDTREQRCWWHKIGNVLAAAKTFADLYGTEWPKATAKVTDDLDELLELYDDPAQHWIHLRTTNPMESTFATVSV